MDINVNLNAGLDEDTKEIAWAFINKFGLCFKDSKTSAEALIKSPEETDKPETKAESVSEWRYILLIYQFHLIMLESDHTDQLKPLMVSRPYSFCCLHSF